MTMKVYCVKCGTDLTRTMKFYVGTDRYCYDCYEAWKEAKRATRKQKAMTDEEIIKFLYKQGYKPSEIAEKTGHSAREVYEVITGW